jgi:NAD(P) transhydrogenase subunit alpha
MIIGIPKEIMQDENRVAATPEICALYIGQGHQVLVEAGAGIGAFFHDEQYLASGAQLIPGAAEVYKKAEIILKVKEPQNNTGLGMHEVDMMHAGQILITFLHPAAPGNHAMVRRLAENGVIALTLDGIPRIPRTREMDALASMSVCAGYKGVLMACGLLPRFVPGMDTPAGATEPANALVVGAGVAGLEALKTLQRLGARIYAADIREEAQELARGLGAELVDLALPGRMGRNKGTAASDEQLVHERGVLSHLLPGMDLVVLSQLTMGREAPVLVTGSMVKTMKPGSVILDISVDQGGNCEMTEPGEIVLRHGVHVIGIKNIPGRLPESSTAMFARNVLHLFTYLTRDGAFRLDRQDEIVRGILTTVDGEVVHAGALEAMAGRV